MSSPGNPMDAVAALMLERQRFEAWIAALDAKRAITPPHVYERVRGDYEARLREVVAKLVGRTGDLKETITALTARMAKLQSDENAKRDERYEAELRATVGEFEPGAWEKLRGSIDDNIARLAHERTGVSTELARVQQILSMAGVPAGAPVGAPAGFEPSRSEAARSPAPSPPTGGAPPSAGVGRPQGGRFDELAFLSSVVEPQAPAPPASNGAPASSVPAAPPSAPTGRQPVQPAQPAAIDADLITKPENADGAVPSYLRDVPTETAKSLKCNECGTMNLPTEWYCERCGGELAAM